MEPEKGTNRLIHFHIFSMSKVGGNSNKINVDLTVFKKSTSFHIAQFVEGFNDSKVGNNTEKGAQVLPPMQ